LTSPKFARRLPLQLPAPRNRDLIEFDPGRPATLRSTSIGRFRSGPMHRPLTVVVRGEGTASNVSYEAIRCKTRERKVYAYGRADGTWSAVRAPLWTTISGLTTDGHRFVLYENYFCPSRQSITSAREGIEALRRAGHPRASDLLTTTPMPR
jgi:hypothetical protein